MKLNVKKANKYAFILILSVIFALIALFLIFDSGNPFDGPQVQGLFILFFGFMVMFGVVGIGFPVAVKIMQRSRRMSYLAFCASLLSIIALSSIISATILGAIGFGFSPKNLLRLFAIQFVVLFLTCLPVSIFWWVVAKKGT